jgi:ubiquinone biosynthesis protein UbiJ
LNPIIWLIGLAVAFVLLDEWQRLRRRVKALEDRVARLERGEGGGSDWPAD